jgi:O-Antigen ligase/Virulence factor membrane-bound polymerase, C-terminal/Protein glycosylation ligase
MTVNIAVALVASFAAALPSLLAYNVAPSATFLNQALAFGLWPLFVAVSLPSLTWRATAPLQTALLTLMLAAAWSWGPGAMPASLALSSLATLLAAALMVAGGAGVQGRDDDTVTRVFAAFCWAWLIAGVLNVLVAWIQVFAPSLTDGKLIATSGLPGRAVGNLRQPNHLSSLLTWSCIAVIALLELRRLRIQVAAPLIAALVFTIVLTASRTGTASLVVLALWGALDRRLSRHTRYLLLAAPVIYGLSWLGMDQWAKLSAQTFGGAKRLEESALGGSRLGILIDTLAMIRQQPWTGVGFGEFNFAWSLTPFPQRPSPFFDHTHNLPLQLIVELGLPLALIVMGLLLWALWRAAHAAWFAAGDLSTAQRCAVMMVLMIGLHSLVEYPLWYSYFLLPAAWAWGFALGGVPSRSSSLAKLEAAPHTRPQAATQPTVKATANAPPRHEPSTPLLVVALLFVLCTGLSVLDYHRVAAIFEGGADAAPLEQRIRSGQRSVFFAHHADYAAVTSGVPVPDPAHAFDRVTHYLLDTRLMIAWSRSLAQQGHLNAARHVAARLREFKKEDAAEFFAACPAAATAIKDAQPNAAFQCELPRQDLNWRDFQVLMSLP